MKIPSFKELNPPDKLGYWTNKVTGEKYGGQYISPLLIPNLKKVEAGFKKAMKNKKFLSNLEEQLVNHIGIVTPILRSKELENIAGGAKKIGKIFLKRTDLHHDSSHKPVSAFIVRTRRSAVSSRSAPFTVTVSTARSPSRRAVW